MLQRVLSGLIFAFVTAAVAPADAADLPVTIQKRKAEPQQARQTAKSNWSGGQVGGSNGVSSVNNNFVEPGAYVCPAAFPFGVSCFESPYSFSGHPLSYTVGPFLGYRWQFGDSVVGVEADWSWKRAENSALVSLPAVCFDVGCLNSRADTKSGSVRQNWDGSLRLRYGRLVTPSTLVYGTAGVAVGNISGSFNYLGALTTAVIIVSPPPIVQAGSFATSAASWSDTRFGGTAGVGVETAIWGAWKARVEYRYTDFGSYTKTVAVNTVCVAATGCSVPSNRATIDLRESFHTVRVGLGFDF
jgi:outer membrane immunogenic protein